jgi:hypothetical protein
MADAAAVDGDHAPAGCVRMPPPPAFVLLGVLSAGHNGSSE